VDHRYLHAKTRFTWPAQSPFGAYPEKPVGIPDELMVGPSISNREETSALSNGLEAFHPKSSKFNSIAEGDVSGKSFKRLHRWRYSPAAAYGHNEVHLHPTAPRRLTVREALRIQAVPDTYAFPSDLPLSHKFKMIGNGVPVKLTQAIAASFATVFAEQGCTAASCKDIASDQLSSQYSFQRVALPEGVQQIRSLLE
jgi:DNA (cytosine-5)-methyltransferase 1